MQSTVFAPLASGSMVALVLALALDPEPAGAQDEAITIAVSTQGASVQVSMDCTVTQNGIDRHEQRQGVAPMEVIFTASAVDCTIVAAGAVLIEAQTADGGSVSKIQTSGGHIRLNLSSG